jgi:hypothetical protein
MDQMQHIANIATAFAKRHSTQKIEMEMVDEISTLKQLFNFRSGARDAWVWTLC